MAAKNVEYSNKKPSYYNVKDGKFEVKDEETKAVESFNCVSGSFNSVRIYEDKGTAKRGLKGEPTKDSDWLVKPSEKLLVGLADSEGLSIISVRAGTVFAAGLMNQLRKLQRGTDIEVVVKPSDQNPKISFANVYVVSEMGDRASVHVESLKLDPDDRLQFVKDAVESHPAKFVFKSDSTEENTDLTDLIDDIDLEDE